jgi:hypothetical protein
LAARVALILKNLFGKSKPIHLKRIHQRNERLLATERHLPIVVHSLFVLEEELQ